MSLDVLIVDDEADIRDLVADILSDEGYETRQAQDSDSALNAIAERLPSVIILDIWLQGSELDGLGVLELVRERYPNIPVIMISGHGNIETAVTSIKMGAYDFIEKPFKEDRLLLVVQRALEKARLQEENSQLRKHGVWESQLIGNSAAINQVRQVIDKVAPTNSRVLITGPAGAGKDVVARLIHAKSRRAKWPFVVINAANMTPERVESELFGEEGGHGRAAGPRSIGMFERAHGGTLLIDEIADMPLETQGKVLRALQEQRFTRVGGTHQVQVDVRVIAATSKDLPKLIEKEQFREDLYYRLNVVPIEVPALNERREDIPLFCDYFLRRSAEMLGLPQRKLAMDAVASLQSYSWPGNVRQLRNLMEWLLIMAPDGSDPIRSSMLPPELFEETPAALKTSVNADIMAMPLREAREVFERQYLTAQINRFGGNISRTSAFVGMERSALHRKLKSLGVHNEEKQTEPA